MREQVRQLTSEKEDWPNFGLSNTLARPPLEEVGLITGYRSTLSGHRHFGNHELEEVMQLR